MMKLDQISYTSIVARVWSDPEFKKMLFKDPAKTLAALGVMIPETIELKVIEDSDSVWNLVIPCRPDNISDDDLEAALKGNPEVMRITPDQVCTGPLSSNICITP